MDFFVSKAYAAYPGPDATSGGTAFDTLLQKIIANIVTPIIYLLFAAAVVYFLWGMVKFINNADSTQKREEGQYNMVYGVIGMFIMVSAKGLINVIMSTLGL